MKCLSFPNCKIKATILKKEKEREKFLRIGQVSVT
jgi:hypothetical protein